MDFASSTQGSRQLGRRGTLHFLANREQLQSSSEGAAPTLDAELTLDPWGVKKPARTPAREALGRYVVLRTLGQGAMGTVYLAFDPELDRKVALKLLHGETSPRRARALLREAQAMAKLSHPNVVGVHDVGEHEGAVYLAMEFVEGVTLRAWLASERRHWRDIVDVFLDAGRGLEAAHRRGLVHRDFKPDNVMVSADGRARVMDFGLARPTSEPTEAFEPGEGVSSSRLDETLPGRVAGTPAYMAPEQTLAEELSSAADQFAFCVTLWEGLCGERPYDGPSYPELLRSLSEGRIRKPPANRRPPRWLERALRRGLRPEPSARWPSMAALMEALERGRKRWRWQAGIAVAALVAIPLGVSQQRRHRADKTRREAVAACEAQGAAIRSVWNEDARQRVRAGLRATGASFAEPSADVFEPWLDDYADVWARGRTQACLHATVDEDWSSERSDRSMWCFEDRQLQLEATVDQISTGDAKAARRAVRLVSYLDPADACLDPILLERLPAPPFELRDRIRSIRVALVDIDRLRHRGEYVDALSAAEVVRADAAALGWPPLYASARMIEGRCLHENGRNDEADAVLTDAYFDAIDAGSVEVAFRAARTLMRVNTSLERYRPAQAWGRHADAVSAGKVDRGGLDEAEGHYLSIAVDLGLGNPDEAIQHGELAIEQRTRTLGDAHPITAAAHRNLGLAYLELGRAEDALVMLDRAYRVWVDAVGSEHPHIGSMMSRQAEAMALLSREDEALALVTKALAVQEAVLAPGHPEIERARALLTRLQAGEPGVGEPEALEAGR
ncbi:MAG: serine/threonine-protein kinase [Myxococcota bacterium]